jgi:2-haloacid dehalogenase
MAATGTGQGGVVMETAASALKAVVFDVNETLFPLEPLDERFAAVGLDPAARPLWFARTLRDGFALAAAGDFRTFPQVAAAALRSVAPGPLDDAAVQTVLGGFPELDPAPDVEPALRRLRAAGVRVVTLTVGSAEVTVRQLERAGLRDLVAETLDCVAPQRWKPAPEPYLYAAERCGCAPDTTALVAAHSWDIHGASSAGLRTGWVSRLEGSYPASFEPADVTGDDLEEVVEALLTATEG